MTGSVSRKQKLIALLKEEKLKTERLLASLGEPYKEEDWISTTQGNKTHGQCLGAINQHEEFLRSYYKIIEEDS